VFGRIPILRDLVHVAIPTSGGSDTVDVGVSTIRDDRDPYAQLFGAGLRIVTDLAHPSGAEMIAVPGQSGNPLSRHFADLLMRWRRFQWLVPGAASGVHVLHLVPQHSATR
jgi:penicillin amidase